MDQARKSPLRLDDDQKYAIYKYVIENRCVTQMGEVVNYRVHASTIANEICTIGLLKGISGQHVKDAVDKVLSWQRRLDKIPAVPKETMEMDMMKVELQKKTRESIENRTAFENAMRACEALKSKIAKAYSILGA